MMHYIDVAHLTDVAPGTCRSIAVTGQCDVAVFNVNGDILAVQDTCPHAGGPLGEGTLDGNIVQCPWHGWAFNVRTGQCLKNPVPAWAITCYPTRVEQGIIQVAFPPPSSEPSPEPHPTTTIPATTATEARASESSLRRVDPDAATAATHETA